MPKDINKKYYLFVLGCQMNKSDSERLRSILESFGFVPTEEEKEADLIGVVACSVRQSAIDRIWGKARAWRRIKKHNPVFKMILTGCVLENDRQKMSEFFDGVFAIADTDKIQQFMANNFNSEGLDLKEYSDYFAVKPRYADKFRAFVPIMTGCNNFCSYCAVPYARGRERSRRMEDVLTEIRELEQNGCLEITLLGQNVNSYKPEDGDCVSINNPYKHPFAKLLWEVNWGEGEKGIKGVKGIKGIRRVFFTASHPKDMDDEVIDALKLPAMLNYVHLPLQSGDDEVLKRMNRQYSAEDFLRIIEKIRTARPEIAIGTDIIVGFPGETAEQFEHTLDLYKKIRFDISYHSKYSPRAGTVSAKFPDNVPLEEKKKRWRKLQNLMEKITLEKNQKYAGRVVEVLVDGFINNGDAKHCVCTGQSREMKLVRFPGEKKLLGKIVSVKIKEAKTWVLEGEKVS